MKKRAVWIAIIIAAITLFSPLGTYAVQNIFADFGKIADIQYSGSNIDQVVYQNEVIWERAYEFSYTGGVQTFTATRDGVYQIELWGAQGGTTGALAYGGYTKGEIALAKNDTMAVYVGERGKLGVPGVAGGAATFNGGGQGGNGPTNIVYDAGASGGGATDIRLSNGVWSDSIGLRSRIMVASGGGGYWYKEGAYDTAKSNAGGLNGYDGALYTDMNAAQVGARGKGATGTAGGAKGANVTNNTGNVNATDGTFGIGGRGAGSGMPTACYGNNGGGGGYYGGGGNMNTGGLCHIIGGGGGSSYISGHTGAVAITSATNQAPKPGCTTSTTNNNCSVHYSGKVFTNTLMIDGGGYVWTNIKGGLELMPKPGGGLYASGTGHIGNGFARVTYLGESTP